MRFMLRGTAIRGPGLPNWEIGAEVLNGRHRGPAPDAPVPSPAGLPPNERRRLPDTARYALSVGQEALASAGLSAERVATVFASCGSDGTITHQICESLAAPIPEMSPTRFHNSVHNSPGGYWSIALGSHAPSTSLCGFDTSFAVGLLEACTQATVENRNVLLIAYDLPYPAPLSSLWSVTRPFAVGLALGPPSCASGRLLSIDVVRAERLSEWPARMPSELRDNPAAASAPLLALLAQDLPGRVVIPYRDDVQIAVAMPAA